MPITFKIMSTSYTESFHFKSVDSIEISHTWYECHHTYKIDYVALELK